VIWWWLLLAAAAAAAAVTGEVHGRRVAYRRRWQVLRGLVVRLEDLAGRWPARRAVELLMQDARMPAVPAVLGPHVALDEIEETDADRAFDPASCQDDCEDCADAVREQADRDAEAGREVIRSIRRAAPDGGDRS